MAFCIYFCVAVIRGPVCLPRHVSNEPNNAWVSCTAVHNISTKELSNPVNRENFLIFFLSK